MTKKELHNCYDNEVIKESIKTYAMLFKNIALDRGTKQLSNHWKDCSHELLTRNILTTDDIIHLNL